jgi:hypothetical protein
MKLYIYLLLLFASCPGMGCTPDTSCADALAHSVAVESPLTDLRTFVGVEVQSLGTEMENLQIPAPRGFTCPPLANQADITIALRRAATAERELEAVRARAKHALETWRDPHGSFDDALHEIENLEQGDD